MDVTQHRVWFPGTIRAGARIELKGEETRRIRRVLRLRPGDKIRLFNEEGCEGEAEIAGFSPAVVELRVLSVESVLRESPLRVHLVQGLSKGDKMSWVIQKATELGAVEVGILLAARCVVRWDLKRGAARMDRWRRVAMEAARQCWRNRIPEISGPWNPEGLAQRAARRKALKILLWEGEGSRGLGDMIGEAPPGLDEAWVVVGPEGGFEVEEVAVMKGAGFRTAKMGPRILRTETAGPAAITVLQYALGDLG